MFVPLGARVLLNNVRSASERIDGLIRPDVSTITMLANVDHLILHVSDVIGVYNE